MSSYAQSIFISMVSKYVTNLPEASRLKGILPSFPSLLDKVLARNTSSANHYPTLEN